MPRSPWSRCARTGQALGGPPRTGAGKGEWGLTRPARSGVSGNVRTQCTSKWWAGRPASLLRQPVPALGGQTARHKCRSPQERATPCRPWQCAHWRRHTNISETATRVRPLISVRQTREAAELSPCNEPGDGG